MATLLQLKCELTAEKEAYTTKSVQIINYIKAKSTLRHIYMIQMCVYNPILAGRLGDCWLAPGKAGWPLRRLLAGPWEGCWLTLGGWLCWETAGWPLGRLLPLAALAALEADADILVTLTWIWLDMVVVKSQNKSSKNGLILVDFYQILNWNQCLFVANNFSNTLHRIPVPNYWKKCWIWVAHGW